MSYEEGSRQNSSFNLSQHRVLQLLPTMDSGGVEGTTVEICEALLEAGSVPFVATQKGRLLKKLIQAGVMWIPGSYATKNPFKILSNIFLLARAIKRHQISLVHARSRAPAWSGYWAARITGIPFITTFHGTYNGTFLFKKYYNSIMTKGRLVIANSQFIQGHIRERYHVLEKKIRVIPRGVDIHRFNPARFVGVEENLLKGNDLFEAWGFSVEDRRLCMILPGRLTSWKGQDFFIEGLKEIDRGQYRAVIIGDCQGRDAYKKSLELKIEALHLSDTIKIVPPSAYMDDVLSVADAVISASQDPEAFGRVMVEALAMGVPVIAGGHGGALEIVDHGETGLLFSPKSLDSFREQISVFLKMKEAARKKMGSLGRQKVVSSFTTEGLCRKTLAVYEEVLKGS